MPLDSRGRADESMLEEMKTAYLGKVIRIDSHSVGIVMWVKTYSEHFRYLQGGDNPLVMRIAKRGGYTEDYYVKPDKIEVWEG